MSAIASNSSLLSRLFDVVETGAAEDASLASAQPAPLSDAWRRLDHRLVDWGRSSTHPTGDDEVEPPSLNAVRRAFGEVKLLIAKGADAPTRAVANGMGGISFEWEKGVVLERMEVGDDGSVEYMLFDGAELIDHQRHE